MFAGSTVPKTWRNLLIILGTSVHKSIHQECSIIAREYNQGEIIWFLEKLIPVYFSKNHLIILG